MVMSMEGAKAKPGRPERPLVRQPCWGPSPGLHSPGRLIRPWEAAYSDGARAPAYHPIRRHHPSVREPAMSTPSTDPRALALVDFWREAGPAAWFAKVEAFDADFRRRFESLHWAAARRELDDWIDTPQGALGLMLLLDQFPRNCFRGTGHMYATDPLARLHARRAIAIGHDQQVEAALRLFFYLPFSHSEDLHDQDLAVERNRLLGGEGERHALGHREIVQRFGRFPHRNRILARESTPQEEAFLREGGFAG